MNIILDSDTILNLDTGIINLIGIMFDDNDVFDIDKVRLLSNDIVLMAKNIITMNNVNPLSIIIRNDYLNKVDKLYLELMNKHLDQIISLSKYTTLERLLKILLLNTTIQPTVLCRNKIIEDYFKKEFPKVKTIVNENYDLDVSQYDAIYVNKYIDIVNFKNLIGKNIYIANTKYNFEEDLKTPLVEVSLKINNANKINIVDIYHVG